MSISMQGAWHVRVKSKSASFPQRFIISGAETGNGIYNGVTSIPEIFVTGNSWTIAIQNDPGSGFLNSTLKLQYPQSIGGEYKFDLQSNDAGGDGDFNDLILSFRIPVSDQDYIVYGNISYYKGCIINPCYQIIVIDTWTNLRKALKNPVITAAVKSYYPTLIDEVMFNPQPEPPYPFKPIMVPLGGPAIPEKEEIISISKPSKISVSANKKDKREAVNYTYNALISTEKRSALTHALSPALSSVDRAIFIDAAKVVDRFRLYCETGPIPHALLKFEEYDRTGAELTGDAYSGIGPRENLGEINADSFGNYLFRFERSTLDVVGEIAADLGAGENAFVQSRPDVIIKLLDQFETTASLFETAPYWNVPYLKRINLCIPKGKSGVIPAACTGQHILQRIGNIALAEEDGGSRVGYNNYLNTNGVITANDDLAPSVQCAAWTGALKLAGCLKNHQIKYYTIESKKGFGPWLPFNQELRLHKRIGSLKILSLVNKSFGPSGSQIDGYLNVETDGGQWLEATNNIKANIRTSAFENGRYTFRIQGYKANGTAFANSSEEITLYLQNTARIAHIDPVITLGGSALGNCALFTLPLDSSDAIIQDAPMTIRFKVEHNPGNSPFGFVNAYAMSVSKGATGNFGLNVPVVNATFDGGNLEDVINRGRKYVHTDNLNCNIRFKGTVNEISADASGYYTVTVQPASGSWLTPIEKFCAFSINLGGTLRLTDGSSGYDHFNAVRVLIGIEKPEL